MIKIQVAEGTLHLSLDNNPDKPMVSSSFEYIQGSVSPYIITSSTVNASRNANGSVSGETVLHSALKIDDHLSLEKYWAKQAS